MAAAISMWLRRGAMAVAASRVGVGFVGLGAPLAISRSWVGRPGDGPPGVVLGRALGSRDLALGLGALFALRRQEKAAGKPPVWSAAVAPESSPAGSPPAADPAGPAPARPAPAGSAPAAAAAALSGAAAWVGLAALADGFDLWTTARSWDELPALRRWLVALSSGGAAAVGAAATV
ncbi:MAG TPA: hypothetical protein VGN41_25740, partial [Streptosporangiaceae bacterium]